MEMEYEKYLLMNDISAGKTLDVILSKKNISQKEFGGYVKRISSTYS